MHIIVGMTTSNAYVHMIISVFINSINYSQMCLINQLMTKYRTKIPNFRKINIYVPTYVLYNLKST